MSVLQSQSKAIHTKEQINTFICIKIRLPRWGVIHIFLVLTNQMEIK
jgi:hypothetical protein